MFNIGDLIICKDKHDDEYGITNKNCICRVVKVDKFDSEDDLLVEVVKFIVDSWEEDIGERYWVCSRYFEPYKMPNVKVR